MKKSNLMKLVALSFTVLGLVSCGGSEGKTPKLAVVTDVGSINDHSFNEACYKGMVDFADANDMGYAYYQPTENSTANRVQTIETAINKGAETIILPGYLFNSSVKQVQDKFPNVNFLGVDVDPSDDDNGYAPYEFKNNVTSLKYAEEQAGFFAGYAAVKDGYTKLGFFGGMSVPAVIKYGQGFVFGANLAAQEMNLADDALEIKYTYCGSFTPDPSFTTTTTSWYTAGTEIIFTCGGGIYSSVLSAANAVNDKLDDNAKQKMVIGVDVDQSWEDPLILTSAMKNMQITVKGYLDDLYANNKVWPSDIAGKSTLLSAKDGAVGLPTETYEVNGKTIDPWRFSTFTKDEYNTVLTKVKNGDIDVPVITSEDAQLTSDDLDKTVMDYVK